MVLDHLHPHPPVLPHSHPPFSSHPSPSFIPPLLILLLILLIPGAPPHGARAISIDNDIVGEPDIECLDQEIRVWVKTRKFFQGRIYAKGKADDPECAKEDFSARRTKKVHFDLGLGRCGMRSLRSFDPRGMYYGVTLVISFHPLFITKVDQAFHVKCFFEEAQRGLTAELGVSMIPTTEVQARHGIPGCSYSIHRSSIDELDAGRPAGSAIQFARVGDKVLHQWHCDDQMFGILINNCFVTDGVKQKHRVIDDKGCPVDPIAITGIRYSADLQRAYAESQVFKFADRPGVWFFCQIQMCMKKGGMCDGVTPPGCATTSPPPKGGGSRPRIGVGRRKGTAGDEETAEEAGKGADDEADSDTEASDSGTASSGTNASSEQDRGLKSSSRGGTVGDIGYDERKEGGEQGQHRLEVIRPVSPASVDDADEGGEDAVTSSTAPGAGRATAPTPPASRQRQRENASGSGGGYAPPPSPIRPANEEDSVFGPGYTAGQVGGLDPYGPQGVGRDPPGGFPSDATPPPNPYLPAGPAPPPPQRLRHQEVVHTEFETEDDLPRSAPGKAPAGDSAGGGSPPAIRPSTTTIAAAPGAGRGAVRKDYADYDTDVTIPPNLTDLLANLQPEDISARGLQRMFRDSVADRRVLLQGFDALMRKMKREEEQAQREGAEGTPRRKAEGEADEEESSLSDKQRMVRRDSPIVAASTDAQPLSDGGQWHAFRPPDTAPDSPTTIAGQLLIYDLDESPPPNVPRAQDSGADCALSRRALALASIGSACGAAALALIALGILARLRRKNGAEAEEEEDEDEGRSGGGMRSMRATSSTSFRDSGASSLTSGRSCQSIVEGSDPGRNTRRRRAEDVREECEDEAQRKRKIMMG